VNDEMAPREGCLQPGLRAALGVIPRASLLTAFSWVWCVAWGDFVSQKTCVKIKGPAEKGKVYYASLSKKEKRARGGNIVAFTSAHWSPTPAGTKYASSKGKVECDSEGANC